MFETLSFWSMIFVIACIIYVTGRRHGIKRYKRDNSFFCLGAKATVQEQKQQMFNMRERLEPVVTELHSRLQKQDYGSAAIGEIPDNGAASSMYISISLNRRVSRAVAAEFYDLLQISFNLSEIDQEILVYSSPDRGEVRFSLDKFDSAVYFAESICKSFQKVEKPIAIAA